MNTIITDKNFQYLGQKISQEHDIENPELQFERFPDGWPNLFAERVKETIEHKDVTYIGDFSRSEDLFMNYASVKGILDYYANKLRIIMPYFPVGTMERIDTKGEIATAKYFADIMSSLPPGREGKTSIHIFDIHALVERFLFDSNTINAEMHTAMSLLREEIVGKTILFPDEGAAKRFRRDFGDQDTIICSKVRVGEKRVVDIKEGDPKGKDIIIIDDLIQTGGTIIETAALLREQGARSVTAYATHGVFPNDSHKKLAESVDTLIVTDSIPENIQRAEEIENMRIFSIQGLVEKIMFHSD